MKKSDVIILFDIDNTLFNTLALKESDLSVFTLYDEVMSTLEELSRIATLGIFSQGEVAFQKKKLQETKIAQYFFEEHTHIAQYKIDVMNEVIGKYKGSKIFFIDDWVDMLRMAKKTDSSVFTIWIKRGEYADQQKEYSDFSPDAVIKNIREVIPLLKESIKNILPSETSS
jgi:FMN phosphatase YigB (HAD superfamily)